MKETISTTITFVLKKQRCSDAEESVIYLMSTWPQEIFHIQDILQGSNARTQLQMQGVSGRLFIDLIVEGLLRLKKESLLTTVNFTGFYMPGNHTWDIL